MLIEILCTGDEILTGKTVNTNYSHMASRLNEVSLKMHWGTIVGDSREDLQEAFEQASNRANIVIVNGGLGPTVDDLSQEIAAEAAGVNSIKPGMVRSDANLLREKRQNHASKQ